MWLGPADLFSHDQKGNEDGGKKIDKRQKIELGELPVNTVTTPSLSLIGRSLIVIIQPNQKRWAQGFLPMI